MKNKYFKMAMGALVLGVSGMALANQAIIKNDSDHGRKPLTITYVIAHQNPGQGVMMGEERTVTLEKGQSAEVSFGLDGYQYAGIIPVKFNNVELPADHRQFNQPEQCSLTTDAKHQQGVMAFELHKEHGERGHHGRLNCSVKGGVFY